MMKYVLTLFMVLALSANVMAAEIRYEPYHENISENLYLNTEIPADPQFSDEIIYYTAEYDGKSHILLPLRSTLNDYASVNWNDAKRLIDVKWGTLTMQLSPNETEYSINGEQSELDAPVYIINSTAYAPLSFYEKVFGFWISDSDAGYGTEDSVNISELFIPNSIADSL